jgi:hypothetical protein
VHPGCNLYACSIGATYNMLHAGAFNEHKRYGSCVLLIKHVTLCMWCTAQDSFRVQAIFLEHVVGTVS